MGSLSLQIKVLNKQKPVLFTWWDCHKNSSEGYLITCQCQDHGLDSELPCNEENASETWSERMTVAMSQAEVIKLDKDFNDMEIVKLNAVLTSGSSKTGGLDSHDLHLEQNQSGDEVDDDDEKQVHFNKRGSEHPDETFREQKENNVWVENKQLVEDSNHKIPCSGKNRNKNQGGERNSAQASSGVFPRVVKMGYQHNTEYTDLSPSFPIVLQNVTVETTENFKRNEFLNDDKNLMDVLGSLRDDPNRSTQAASVDNQCLNGLTPEEFKSIPKTDRIREYEEHQIKKFLEKHQRLNSANKVVLCELCGAACASRYSYNNHLTKIHKKKEKSTDCDSA